MKDFIKNIDWLKVELFLLYIILFVAFIGFGIFIFFTLFKTNNQSIVVIQFEKSKSAELIQMIFGEMI